MLRTDKIVTVVNGFDTVSRWGVFCRRNLNIDFLEDDIIKKIQYMNAFIPHNQANHPGFYSVTMISDDQVQQVIFGNNIMEQILVDTYDNQDK